MPLARRTDHQEANLESKRLFIWAATACRFAGDGKRFAVTRPAKILEGDIDSTTAPAKHLNEIYITFLKQSISPDFTDEEIEDPCCMLSSWNYRGFIVSPLYRISLYLDYSKSPKKILTRRWKNFILS